MNNIAIIGVGALGRRHLQSMMDLQEKYSIFAVEVNTEAVMTLKEEFPFVHFSTSTDNLPEELEAVVIATNSNIRRQVFEQLINHSIVSNILFEKVLFQKEQDYYFVQNKLNELGIHAWVNCARREWDSYKSLKSELASCKNIQFLACGGRWGLGCNGIHMLDLIEYLADSKVDKLDVSGLEKGIIESKRKGFYEFYGTIIGSAGKCKSFTITCVDSELPFRIEIITDTDRYIIDEGHNHMMQSNVSSEWKWVEKDFKQVYQSQMTGRVVKSIIENGTCNLPEYNASKEQHLKYIMPLLDFFKENGFEGDVCPIT